MSEDENDKNFLIIPKSFGELGDNEKEFLIEHYRRASAFWRHWTHTIWSIPSVAAAINIGFYSFFFGNRTNIDMPLKAVILMILLLLNIALTIGLWKHRYMQYVFGDRLMEIERFANIIPIEFSPIQKKISGSLFFIILMVVISLASLGFLITEMIC